MEEKSINVESIMQELQQKAEEIAFRDPVPFEKIPVKRTNARQQRYSDDDMTGIQLEMNSSVIIPFRRKITGNPIARLIKIVLRKMLLFMLKPMCEEISQFHSATADAVAQLAAFAREQTAENEKKTQEILRLEARIAALEQQPGREADPAE